MHYISKLTLAVIISTNLMKQTSSLPNKSIFVNYLTRDRMTLSLSRNTILQKRSPPTWKYNSHLINAVAQASTLYQFATRRRFCLINVKFMRSLRNPLFIDPQDHSKFFYPDSNGFIKLQEGESIHLACPGYSNFISKVPTFPQYHTAKCIDGLILDIDHSHHDVYRVLCSEIPRYVILKNSYVRQNESTHFRIGYYTDASESFAEVIYIQRDVSETSTIYVRSLISQSIGGAQSKAKKYKNDQSYCCRNYGSINMDDLYVQENQMRTLQSQFVDGTDADGNPYFDGTKRLLFTQEYLASSIAFVYKAEAYATFTYLNVAPQWKIINENIWKVIDKLTVKTAKELANDLIVYTGTLDQLELLDYIVREYNATVSSKVYLYHKNGLSLFPVPLFSWKLVYEPQGNKGDVFVSVNNPHKLVPKYNEKCEKPKYVSGLAYASVGLFYRCAIDDFIKYNNLNLIGLSAERVSQSLFDDYSILAMFGPDVMHDLSSSGRYRLTHDELR